MISRTLATILFGLASMGAAEASDMLELQGRGVQIYHCGAGASGFAWTLKGPDATLATLQGQPAGHHFAGPSWQATDGSMVTGEVLASGDSRGTDGALQGVPWLVLRAKSHAGSGLFAHVAYITRSHTQGGLKPGSVCDTAHAGQELRVPYTAAYTFFSGPIPG